MSPGPIARSSSGCGPKASGNKLAVTTKKNNAASASARRRNAIATSRAISVLIAGSIGKGDSLRRRKIGMGRHDDDPAGVEMGLRERCDERACLRIERRQRFIEDPQRRLWFQGEPSQ